MRIQTLVNKTVPNDPTTAALLSTVRSLLVAVGTGMVAHGWLKAQPDDIEAVAGFVVAVLPAAWGVWNAAAAWYKAHFQLARAVTMTAIAPDRAEQIITDSKKGPL